MYSRIFAQTGAGSVKRFFVSSAKNIPNIRLGRMAPETTIDTIEQELHTELNEKGLIKLGKTLEEETKNFTGSPGKAKR